MADQSVGLGMQDGQLLEMSIVAYPGPGYGVYPINATMHNDAETRTRFCAALADIWAIPLTDDEARRMFRRADVDTDWMVREAESGNERVKTFVLWWLKAKHEE